MSNRCRYSEEARERLNGSGDASDPTMTADGPRLCFSRIDLEKCGKEAPEALALHVAKTPQDASGNFDLYLKPLFDIFMNKISLRVFF